MLKALKMAFNHFTFDVRYIKVENNQNLRTPTMLLWKWDVSEDVIGAVLTAVLKTPGLIMVEYWHQVCCLLHIWCKNYFYNI